MNHPVSLTQYRQQLPMHCPAATAAWNQWETTLTSRRPLGFWRNNQTYYAQGAFRIQQEKTSGFHGIGLGVYYDKEGTYLRRYRGYLMYAYHLDLSPTLRFSGGLAVGLMSYHAGNSEYDGGIGNGIDGTLGCMLSGSNFFLAASIAQLPESKIRPINEVTLLKRYYQLMGGRDIEVGPAVTLKPHVNVRAFSLDSVEVTGQAGFVWKEAISLYGSYMWKRRASLLFGLEKIELDGVTLKAFFSYDVPVDGASRYQAFEVTLQVVKAESKRNTTQKKRRKKK